MTESQATTAILRKLKEYGHFWKASDRYVAGIPDIVGCVAGRFCGVEMKIDYNSPTPLQVHTLCKIIKCGGYAGVVTYSNKSKGWWLRGTEYKLSDVADHIIEKAKHGGNDIED